jgi:2-polyprenyl-6-methoxyphenol hydroxylase-like FAD-dependent oxidoreductase
MSSEPRALRSGATYDVIVVGGRAAGASTAMLLARGGLRTLLIEAGAPEVDPVSTSALMRAGVLQLSRWGLLDELVAAGTPSVHRRIVRYGDETLVVRVQPCDGIDALFAPKRVLLDPLLVRAATEAGAEVHHATSVADVVVDGGRVAGVRAVTPDNRLVEVGAALVIGADGTRSTIAPRVGAAFSRVGEHASATTYSLWSDLRADGYEWTYRPNGCTGVVPTNDGQTCVFVSASPKRIGKGGVACIREVVDESAPELADRLRAATPRSASRTWRGRRGYMRRSCGRGWALVGDAAYFKDPISHHGLTDALRDAELLARAVVHGTSDGDPAVLDQSLEEYQSIRDRLSAPLFDVVDRIASQQWNQEEIARLQRQLSSTMADEVETLTALEPGAVT